MINWLRKVSLLVAIDIQQGRGRADSAESTGNPLVCSRAVHSVAVMRIAYRIFLVVYDKKLGSSETELKRGLEATPLRAWKRLLASKYW